MKTLIFVILCLVGNLAFSQSKSETEEWIKSKIESAGLTGYQEYQVYYDGDFLSIGNKTFFPNLTVHKGFLVTIKCISNFYFKDYGESLHLIIKTSSNCKIQQNNFTDETIGKVNEVELILDKSFADNDMKNRFTNAMNNLIKFYGGSVVKEVY